MAIADEKQTSSAILDARGIKHPGLSAQGQCTASRGGEDPWKRLASIMATVSIFVNALPPTLAPERAAELLAEYRRERDFPTADSPPRWYIEALIAALTPLVAETAVRR